MTSVQDWWESASDRERDALVAEKVMGGKWIRWYDVDYKSPDGPLQAFMVMPYDQDSFLRARDHGNQEYVVDTGELPRRASGWCPSFSTDRDLIWDILEKFQWFTIDKSAHKGYGGEFMVAVGNVYHHDATVYDNDLCHAVCLAALEAVGEPE
jgi:hypothetical protein